MKNLDSSSTAVEGDLEPPTGHQDTNLDVHVNVSCSSLFLPVAGDTYFAQISY